MKMKYAKECKVCGKICKTKFRLRSHLKHHSRKRLERCLSG